MSLSLERKTNIFSDLILIWSEKNYRNFPWRKDFDNPYKILCTEILLQKTSAEKVLNIYYNFFDLFPTEKELSEANLNAIADVVKPTGLQNKKSQSLKDSANWILKNGIILDSIHKLKSEVKGVSDYAVNAVKIFCFGENVPLIDINVRKIAKIIFETEDESDIKNILSKSTKKLDENDLKRFYLALIDLGAAFRSLKSNPLDENVVIVTVDENSYKKLREENFYWRFKHIAFKKKVSYIAFYRKSPFKSLFVFGKIRDIKTNEIVKYYLNPLFELDPPILIEKGEYPPVSYKYTKLFKILNATKYSDI